MEILIITGVIDGVPANEVVSAAFSIFCTFNSETIEKIFCFAIF
jgi:hypothetical protein